MPGENSLSYAAVVTLEAAPYSLLRYLPWRWILLVLYGLTALLEAVLQVWFLIPVAAGLITLLAYGLVSHWHAVRESKRFIRREGNPRLICSGNPSDLMDLIDIEDFQREPYIVDYVHFNPHASKTIVIIGLGIVIAVVLNLRGMHARYAMLSVAVAIGLERLISRTFFAQHIRISPGRLEFISTHPISGKLGVRRMVDLSLAMVICRFETATISIAPLSGQTITIRLDYVKNRGAFVRALFAAGSSKWAAPALPQHELLG
jgi:hypothetical protein